MREGTRPCDACGGAGVDAHGYTHTCTKCRGHGFLPAPCPECGELCEGAFCSAPCEAASFMRRRT